MKRTKLSFTKTGTLVRALFLLGIGAGVSMQSASAHHSFAGAYFMDRPLAIEGTVAEWNWTSPHVQLLLDVTNEDGSSTTWDVELGAIRALTVHLGWSRDMISVGDEVKVSGFLSRSDEHGAAAARITIATGEELRAVRQIE